MGIPAIRVENRGNECDSVATPVTVAGQGVREPFLSEFRRLVADGVGTQDIHDSAAPVGYAVPTARVAGAYAERELGRVALHQRNLCPLLEAFVGRADRVLDVGCNTGGTSVALALSTGLRPEEVVGVDPNRRALEAAEARARMHGLPADRVRFLGTAPGAPLPFPDGSFDLTTCVSVLEFVSRPAGRAHLIGELRRVTRTGGYIFLATPSPFRLCEFHSRRVFGDFRRRDGFPWSSPQGQLRTWFRGCDPVPIEPYLARRALGRLSLPAAGFPGWAYWLVVRLLRWQKLLFRKVG